MRDIALPVALQEEVEAYLLYMQQVPDLKYDLNLFLGMLSPYLRTQLLMQINNGILREVPQLRRSTKIE